MYTAGAGRVEAVDVERPVPGPKDILLKVRACGICGTDVSFLHMGGMPARAHLGGRPVPVPLGHEPAGEIVEARCEAEGLAVGDRVVVNPQNAPTGINEPMAAARHCVNRSGAGPGDKVVVFGAGPIGLDAAIWQKLRGVAHVAVADVIPSRLEKAPAVGADAVTDSAREDVTARLTELHGQGANALGQPRPDTDIHIDAAGVAAVFNTVVAAAKWHAKLVMVAVQKTGTELDLGGMLRSDQPSGAVHRGRPRLRAGVDTGCRREGRRHLRRVTTEGRSR
ncbi:alcohol dehydrogenase catalytic domain-containing protein [Streptomyces alanosinicus]|uniref:2-deoxy-scyllo-inosamine dehydrogenase n=1 Tax=Streptomyces alanosinicus TaxID=68171 RepID=A0A918YJ50_9ACTN|nr:alcohol dehydrogenase catalytic domain-containing protein [Streptomyces alanosinicus]GHE04860.1 threonine dehydrogenase [Streptomyces alanosinicus]